MFTCVFVIWFLSSFCVGCNVCHCLFFFVSCLEFQIIRLVNSTFTPIFFIEISFVTPPPPQAKPVQARRTQCRAPKTTLVSISVPFAQSSMAPTPWERTLEVRGILRVCGRTASARYNLVISYNLLSDTILFCLSLLHNTKTHVLPAYPRSQRVRECDGDL